ncbi:MAG: GTP-binding protein, partial [Ferruginibacter sp.]
TGVMLLNGAHGVEVGTDIIWEYTESFKTPMLFAVNKLDEETADFEKTVQQAKNHFGGKITVVQYPLNQGTGFNAIVDVLKMSLYQFSPSGGKPEKLPIPDSEKEKADELHRLLVEAVAVNDE